MKRLRWGLLLAALLIVPHEASSQARPPAQQSGPLKVYGPARIEGPLTVVGPGSTGDVSGMTTAPAGASRSRTLVSRANDNGRNVRDFLLPNEAACDGTTDNADAFQRAFDSGARVVKYDLEGCASHWLINTTVTIPGGSALIGPGDGRAFPLGIRTTAAVDTFKVGGDSWEISNTRIQHDGSAGMLISAGTSSYGSVAHNYLQGTTASATSPMIEVNGSLVKAEDNTFTNYRKNAYSYIIRAKTVQPTIVHRLKDNNFGGTGKGMYVLADPTFPRPEGIYLTTNHCFLVNECLEVQSVNDLRSVGNTYDIGGDFQVVLASSGQGIDLVSFTDDYFSTLVPGQAGNPTNANASCLLITGAASRVTVKGGKFAYCGYGVSSTDGLPSKMTISASFLNIANAAVNLQGVNGATLVDSSCTSCTFNFILADGANGGPYIVNNNQFDPNGSFVLTQTDPNKFRFGNGNTGRVLAGSFSATTGSMATGQTCSVLGIPHTLGAAPNLDKTTASARTITGTMSSLNASVLSADAGSITVQVCGNVTTAGTARATVTTSL